jgi:hypothetical protein
MAKVGSEWDSVRICEGAIIGSGENPDAGFSGNFYERNFKKICTLEKNSKKISDY